jgi:hypothetical protein
MRKSSMCKKHEIYVCKSKADGDNLKHFVSGMFLMLIFAGYLYYKGYWCITLPA